MARNSVQCPEPLARVRDAEADFNMIYLNFEARPQTSLRSESRAVALNADLSPAPWVTGIAHFGDKGPRASGALGPRARRASTPTETRSLSLSLGS